MVSAKTRATEAHFVTGSDEAAVRKAAMELAKELAPDADVFGLEVIDGAADNVEAAINALQQASQALLTLPFLGGSKLVWLKNASFLADAGTGRSESVTGALERLCEVLESGLPDGVNFLLSAPLADKRRSGYKLLAKLATTAVYDLPNLGFRGDEEAIAEWTAVRARERGLQLLPDAVEILAARVGLNPLQLESELGKLETAFGTGAQINSGDVRLLVPQTREGGIFDLSDAILKRDLALALETLHQLIHQGERGIGILLAAVVPTVRNLLVVKDLILSHNLSPPSQPQFFAGTLKRLSPAETAHLPRKKDGTLSAYLLGIAAASASHYSLEELKRGFAACAVANQQLLSGTLIDAVVMERLLIDLLSRKDRQTG
jgi:DNA polymerase III subunit delta